VTALGVLRWVLGAIALTAVAIAATRPWYQPVYALSAPAPAGRGILAYLNLYALPEPPPQPAAIWVLKILAALATLAAVAVALRRPERGSISHAGTITVAFIAGAVSIYVGASADRAWASGLSWLWGAATALELLAVASLASPRLSSGRAPASARQ
jgi:hypothetical protein